MSDMLIQKARAGRRRALAAIARGAKGVEMLTERDRPPRLTTRAAQRFMAAA